MSLLPFQGVLPPLEKWSSKGDVQHEQEREQEQQPHFFALINLQIDAHLCWREGLIVDET